MCDPVTATVAGVTAVVEGASAIAEHKAQKKQYKQNEKSAMQSLRIQQNDLSRRQIDETTSAGMDKVEAGRQAAETAGLVRASAAEAGVAGSSVDLLLQDNQRDLAAYNASVDQNLVVTVDQLERMKTGAAAEAQARINSVAKPSGLLTGLRIGSAVLNAGTQFYRGRKGS